MGFLRGFPSTSSLTCFFCFFRFLVIEPRIFYFPLAWMAVLCFWVIPGRAENPGDLSKGVEKIQVTGSHIKRTDVEGPSPVVVIDQEEIERSGFDSVGTLLARSNLSPFGGGETVNLRGIGPARTLILINGQRAPSPGSSYGSKATSANFVPIAAVERIEILADGGSALYGADALGGVVNVITKKDWKGLAFVGKYNIDAFPGGDSYRASLAYGNTLGKKGNFLTSLQYQGTGPRRPYDNPRLRGYYVDWYRSTNYSVDGGDLVSGPNCTAKTNNGVCAEDTLLWSENDPSHGIDWVTDFDYNLGGDTELYSTLLVGYRRNSGRLRSPVFLRPTGDKGAEKPGGGFVILREEIEDKIIEDWGVPTSTFEQIKIGHHMKDLPGQRSLDENTYLGWIVGTRGYWGSSSWSWDVTLNTQLNESRNEYKNLALYRPVRDAVVQGTYNPFQSKNDNIPKDFTYDASMRNLFQLYWLEAKSSGDLGAYFGFNWSGALGASAAHFAYGDYGDPRAIDGEVMGLTGRRASGSRQNYALFAELSGLMSNFFEVQLSLREDIYSDFGTTFNPKIALSYQPFSMVKIRSSYGTGFQAPALREVYGPRLQAFVGLVDRRNCEARKEDKYCEARVYPVKQGGNLDLKEETSQNFTAGLILQPVKQKDLSLDLSLDYWGVDVRDTVSSRVRDLMWLELEDPDLPKKYGDRIERNEQGDIEYVQSYLANIGQEFVHGLDIGSNFNFSTFIGNLALSTNHTIVFDYYRSVFSELGRQQFLGRSGLPKWRNNTTLTYSGNLPLSLTFTARSVGGQETLNRKDYIPSFVTFDGTLEYTPSLPWLSGRFQIGALNMFNQSPVYDFGLQTRVDTSLFTPERVVFLTYMGDW